MLCIITNQDCGIKNKRHSLENKRRSWKVYLRNLRFRYTERPVQQKRCNIRLVVKKIGSKLHIYAQFVRTYFSSCHLGLLASKQLQSDHLLGGGVSLSRPRPALFHSSRNLLIQNGAHMLMISSLPVFPRADFSAARRFSLLSTI